MIFSASGPETGSTSGRLSFSASARNWASFVVGAISERLGRALAVAQRAEIGRKAELVVLRQGLAADTRWRARACLMARTADSDTGRVDRHL
jgi:hypothetical protein